MDAFRCYGLKKSFDGVCALADVHLEFPSSGITAIIGPNGAGKSTLLNTLTGFVRPDAGICRLREYETTRLSPYRIARLGVARTFQDLRLILQVSAIDNVLLARQKQRGESLRWALLRYGVAREETSNRAEAIRLLRAVGLESKDSEQAGDLSYGQQKLLSIACCIATGAQILLLDEPVAGVHPEMASQIVALLRQLCDDGKLIVFIEHDLGTVRQLADHVVVMDEGKVIAEGPPFDVLERPDIMEAYIG